MSADPNEIIDAEFDDANSDTRFARIFAAHEQLDILFDDPDAVGDPRQALDAMRFQAALLNRELQAATVDDFNEEYEES